MGLITGIPAAPFKGLIKLAEILHEQAERELHDPAAVRRRLEDLEEARASGEISEQEESQAQEEIVGAMIHQPTEDEASEHKGQGEREGR
jgi:hypothetical protein